MVLNDFRNSSCALLGNTSSALYEDAFMSQQTHRMIRAVVGGVIMILITTVGVIGNIVNLLVFWRQGLTHRMNLSLFLLSTADLLFELYAFVVSLHFLLIEAGILSVELFYKVFSPSMGISFGLKITSACYFMVITTDRCICVLFPLHAASFIRTRTLGLVFAIIPVFVLIGCVSIALKYQIQIFEICGSAQWHLIPSSFASLERELFDNSMFVLMFIVLPIFNLFVVVAETIIILVKLKLTVKWQERTVRAKTKINDQQMALTKMFIVLSCMYSATATPNIAMVTTYMILRDSLTSPSYLNMFLTQLIITSLFCYVDSAMKVFIYFFRSSKFRLEFRSLFCFKNSPHAGNRRPSTTFQVSML